jgi:amino acid transporter
MQLTPLSSRLVDKPKKDVPIVMCGLIVVGVCMNFALFTLACSQDPGIDGLSNGDFPLNYGLEKIFGVSYESAAWLNAPCLFATAFGFIFFCGRQLSCMAGSKLLPEVFQVVIPAFDTPYVSIIAFALMSFLLNIITFYYEDSINVLYIISSLSSFIVYILALVGYIRFHKRYSSLERFFSSPLGVYGAYVGIVIFVFCAVGAAAFRESFIPIIVIGVVAVLAVIYFIFFSGEHVFSEEEREELFKAYLVNGKCHFSFL